MTNNNGNNEISDFEVVHVLPNLGFGGAETAAYRLTRGLEQRGIACTVLCLDEAGPGRDRMLETGASVVEVDIRHRPLTSLRTLARSVENSDRPKIVHAWMYHANLAVGLASIWVRDAVPQIWSLRTSSIGQLGFSTWTTAKLGACLSKRIPTAIVCCSEAVRASHAEFGFHPPAMATIPNSVPFRAASTNNHQIDIRRQFEIPRDAFVVGRAARYHPVKGYDLLLEVASHVVKSDGSIHFLLCGINVDRRNRILASEIERRGLASNVHLLGCVNEMAGFYSACDITCSTSLPGEGFPNVLIESLAFGTPVVATDSGASREIVPYPGGIVSSNPESISSRILELREMRRAASRTFDALAEWGKNHVHRHYSLRSMLDRYIELYRATLFVSRQR